MYKGVARMMIGDREFDIRGLPAWVAARTYHVYAMPTFGRKAAVLAGWATNLISRRDIIGIPESTTPRAAFEYAANTGKKKRSEERRVGKGGRTREAEQQRSEKRERGTG